MKRKIGKLFEIRDKAVLENDEELFLSTQKGEIPNSAVEGYLKTDKLESIVIHIHNDDLTPNYKVFEDNGKLLISNIVW